MKPTRKCITCSVDGDSNEIQPNPFTREYQCSKCGSLFRRCLLPIFKHGSRASFQRFMGSDEYAITHFAKRYKEPVLSKVSSSTTTAADHDHENDHDHDHDHDHNHNHNHNHNLMQHTHVHSHGIDDDDDGGNDRITVTPDNTIITTSAAVIREREARERERKEQDIANERRLHLKRMIQAQKDEHQALQHKLAQSQQKLDQLEKTYQQLCARQRPLKKRRTQ